MLKNNKISKNIELIVFIIFCLSTFVVSLFHEFWFDELQAWAISKDSISNILFFLPHYEGHPPLWHLILKCFSVFNINPEIALRVSNLLFMYAAVWLLIFKSPFPKCVKLLLPFSYFIFYQYTIINRPYSIFCFALFLIATLYKTRNEKPFRFITALAILCLSSAYGMFLTAGIAIVWGIEVLKELKFKLFLKDRRFHLMLALFFLSLILLLEIYPEKNIIAFSDSFSYDNTLKFLYSFFVLSADATVLDFFNEMNLSVFFIDISDFFKTFSDTAFNQVIIQFWLGCFIGLAINLIIFFVAKDLNKKLFFFVPYLLFCLMAMCIYLKPHHIGLLNIFYIFALWCMFADSTKELNSKCKKALCGFCVIFFVIQIYWSISSSIEEIKSPYAPTHQIVSFIKNHHLENYKIMCSWSDANPIYVNKKTGKIYVGEAIDTHEKYIEFIKNYELRQKISNMLAQPDATVINSYFDKNIFYNYNVDYPDKKYTFNKKLTDIETEKLRIKWEHLGLPDFIIGETNLKKIFKNDKNIDEKYILIKEFESGFIWKDKYILTNLPVYINKNL